jgi:hypothetical protein
MEVAVSSQSPKLEKKFSTSNQRKEKIQINKIRIRKSNITTDRGSLRNILKTGNSNFYTRDLLKLNQEDTTQTDQ